MKNWPKWKKILLAAIIVWFVVFIGYRFVIYSYYYAVSQKEIQFPAGKWGSAGQFSDSFNPSGHIHLTLKKKGFFPDNDLGSYQFNISSYNLELNKALIGLINGNFSDDGSESVFLTREGDGGKNIISQIVKIDHKIDPSKKRITSSNTLKESPRLSPDGRSIVYVVIDIDAKSYFTPEEKSVYITDLNGKEKFITKGVQPFFLTDKKILVLKNKGIYVVDIDNNKEWLGIPFNIGALRSMKLGFSKNGNMLAVSDYKKSEVTIFKINNWEESSFSYYVYKKIPISGFWPVFSPDGRYLAVQEVKLTDPPSNPRLVIYNIETLEWKEMINLSDYEQAAMWINDWK